MRVFGGGFPKIYRSTFRIDAIARNPMRLALWVHLVERANWKPTSITWEGQRRIVPEHVVVTGWTSLSRRTGIPKTTLIRAMRWFQAEGFIAIESSNSGLLIWLMESDIYTKDSKSGPSADQGSGQSSFGNFTGTQDMESPTGLVTDQNRTISGPSGQMSPIRKNLSSYVNQSEENLNISATEEVEEIFNSDKSVDDGNGVSRDADRKRTEVGHHQRIRDTYPHLNKISDYFDRVAHAKGDAVKLMEMRAWRSLREKRIDLGPADFARALEHVERNGALNTGGQVTQPFAYLLAGDVIDKVLAEIRSGEARAARSRESKEARVAREADHRRALARSEKDFERFQAAFPDSEARIAKAREILASKGIPVAGRSDFAIERAAAGFWATENMETGEILAPEEAL